MERDEQRTFKRNALSSYAVRALLGISVLLLTPYLFRALGAGGFGTWSVMLAVTIGLVSLLELGFSAGITKLVADHRGAGDLDRARDTVATGAWLMTGLGLLCLVVSVTVGFAADGLAAADERDSFRDGMVVLGIAALVRLPCMSYAAALAGYQRYDLFNVGQAVTYGGFAVGAVAVVEAGGGVFALAAAQGAALALGGLVCIPLMMRIGPTAGPRPGEAAERRRIAGFSSLTLAADSMLFVAWRIDTVIIAALRSAAAAAPYAVAIKFRSVVESLVLPLTYLLMPMIADLRSRGAEEEAGRRFVVATRVVIQAALPASLAIALFSADLVHVWIGASAPRVSDELIVLVIAASFMANLATPAERVLIGAGRMRPLAALSGAEAVVNLTLTIVLVIRWGALGAAIATLVTSGLTMPARLPMAARALGLARSRLLLEGIWPAIVATAPAALAMCVVLATMQMGAARLAVGLGVGALLAVAAAALQLGPKRALRLAASLRPRGTAPATLD